MEILHRAQMGQDVYIYGIRTYHIYTSPKKLSKGKQAHVGMERSKTSRTRWERHHNTFTPSLHLVPFCQLGFVFVSCVHRRVEEGSGEGIAMCCAC